MSTKPNPSDMVIGTDTLHHLVQKTKHTQFWPFRTPCFGQILPFLATVYLMIFGPNAHFSCQQTQWVLKVHQMAYMHFNSKKPTISTAISGLI